MTVAQSGVLGLRGPFPATTQRCSGPLYGAPVNDVRSPDFLDYFPRLPCGAVGPPRGCLKVRRMLAVFPA
jgi:hypothetical protein